MGVFAEGRCDRGTTTARLGGCFDCNGAHDAKPRVDPVITTGFPP
jgi:hypothetical protein